MEDEELRGMFNCLNLQLNRIADSLEVLARPGQDYSPNYVKPIEEYTSFDWQSINASVVRTDRDGPTHIQWNGQVYTRRSPSNKFEPAIWFSRAAGKSEEGETEYAKLITFREIKEADPLPEKAREVVSKNQTRVQMTNGTNGKPGATPRPSAALSTPSQNTVAQPVFVSYADYIRNAKASNITQEAATWIAKQCRVPPENDHSVPNTYLKFFYEAKHAGKKLSEAWAHLEANGFDPKKAITSLPNF